jgi:gamma-glutamylcyclotransferase (GGCT)/AIG2-like uncharacterized protein YtfP
MLNHHVLADYGVTERVPGLFATVRTFRLLGRADRGYPYLLGSQHPEHPGSSTCVVGELYRLQTHQLWQLDEFEGEPYQRRLISVRDLATGQQHLAHVYLVLDAELEESMLKNVLVDESVGKQSDDCSQSHERLVSVPGGDWVRHLQQLEQLDQCQRSPRQPESV